MRLKMKNTDIEFYQKQGYLALYDILSAAEVEEYRRLYDQFLSGEIDTGANRGDLGAGLGNSDGKKESITQIMWPSDFAPLAEMPYHQRCLQIARELMGEDMEMDFDMMIDKAPHTNTPTPWHQDAAYWVDLPDKRAVSFWLALDEATADNGCMWYVPGSHLQAPRPHWRAENGHALICACDETEGVAVPLRPGSCVLHHGDTLHYSRGNSTDFHRRALIVNYRPKAMIELERAKGFDHGRNQK